MEGAVDQGGLASDDGEARKHAVVHNRLEALGDAWDVPERRVRAVVSTHLAEITSAPRRGATPTGRLSRRTPWARRRP